MKFLSCVILLGVLGVVVDADVKSEFESSKLVPDILDEAPPKEFTVIKFGDQEVHLGNQLKPADTQQIPEIHYEHEGGVLYTLIFTDPDVPTRGYNRELQHWVVGNIPEDKVAKGEVLTEFIGPATPANTGKHRYTFLLYKQNQGAITFDERRISSMDLQRGRFSTKKFVEKYNLEGPIAGNFFLAEYDESVPEIMKKYNLGK